MFVTVCLCVGTWREYLEDMGITYSSEYTSLLPSHQDVSMEFASIRPWGHTGTTVTVGECLGVFGGDWCRTLASMPTPATYLLEASPFPHLYHFSGNFYND